MIGSRFKGIVEQINYHSQHGITNTGGFWRAMEIEWVATINGKAAIPAVGTRPAVPAVAPQTVTDVIIVPNFDSGVRRPKSFTVNFSYGGNAQPRRDIDNP